MKWAGQEALTCHISDQKFNESYWSYSVESVTIATTRSLTFGRPHVWWACLSSKAPRTLLRLAVTTAKAVVAMERNLSNLEYPPTYFPKRQEGKTFLSHFIIQWKKQSVMTREKQENSKHLKITHPVWLEKVFSFSNYIQAPYFIPSNPKSTISY